MQHKNVPKLHHPSPRVCSRSIHMAVREVGKSTQSKTDEGNAPHPTVISSQLTSSPDHRQHLHSDYFSSNGQKTIPRTRTTSNRITKRIYHVQEESYQQASHVGISSSDYRRFTYHQRTRNSPSLPTYLSRPYYEIDARYGGLRQSNRVSHYHALWPWALGRRIRGRFVLLRSW